MKILAVSDREEKALYDFFMPERWQGIDLIISCGDLAPEYLSFLVTMMHAPLFYVRGNHDEGYVTEPPEGCDDLDGRLVKFKGLRIAGLEGSYYYSGRGVQYKEGQMWWKAARLRPRIWLAGGLDILVTHAPARGLQDAPDLPHRGFEIFNGLIKRYQPRLFLHGHTHLSYDNSERERMVGGTRVVNAFGYTVIDLDAPISAKHDSAAV